MPAERPSTAEAVASLARLLSRRGHVAADEEAAELVAAARDEDHLAELVQRRLTGEPLAWVTGQVLFCGLTVGVVPGVYVPRWQSEPLARLAAAHLPARGIGVDLCTGTGAVAMVMQRARPRSTVLGTELDPRAAGCARTNGVDVREGYLDEPLPAELAGRVDVMVGVLPYVPADELRRLPRDVRDFEPRLALDGGPRGTDLLTPVVERSVRWLADGGRLLLELGGDQATEVARLLSGCGFDPIEVLDDEDGDVRGIHAALRVMPATR